MLTFGLAVFALLRFKVAWILHHRHNAAIESMQLFEQLGPDSNGMEWNETLNLNNAKTAKPNVNMYSIFDIRKIYRVFHLKN